MPLGHLLMRLVHPKKMYMKKKGEAASLFPEEGVNLEEHSCIREDIIITNIVESTVMQD